MIEYILSKYPGLTSNDIRLQDDGEGVFVSSWKSDQPKPSTEQLVQWQQEIDAAPKPLSPLEQLQKDQAELTFLLMLKGVL